MPARLPRPRLLRRLGAMLLVLSVLVTTLGWAHPPCDMATGAAGSGDHAGGMTSGEHDEPAGGAPRHDCPDHDSQQQQQPSGCPMVAHCAPGFTVPTIATTILAAAPLPQPEGIPQSPPPAPSAAPEAPPPRA